MGLSPKASPRDSFLVFGSPLIEEPEIAEVVASLRSGWLGTGPKVAQFEKDFAAYKGVPHAVAVNSCTAALHVSMIAAGLKPGDEVITTPLTFCATANAIIHAGATPVLADVDPATMNIDPAQIERRLTPRTRALLPVHFAGRPCDMDAIEDIARRHNLLIIEDCAHAIETEYHGRKSGTFGDYGCFSFYVTKNIVTGEGGMVLARDEEKAARIKVLALHGMSRDAWKRYSASGSWYYEVVLPGFKCNMTDIQAALGLQQLHKLPQFQERRCEIVRQYQAAFAAMPELQTPTERPEVESAWHIYALRLNLEQLRIDRAQFIQELAARNIGTSVHFIPNHLQPYYRDKYGYQPEDFPVAYREYQRLISLPLNLRLSDADVEDVIEAVKDIVATYRR